MTTPDAVIMDRSLPAVIRTIKDRLNWLGGHRISIRPPSTGPVSGTCLSCGYEIQVVRMNSESGYQWAAMYHDHPCSDLAVNLGGVVPLSTVDYPGLSSTVIFLRGCPNKCLHCHNPGLQDGHTFVPLGEVVQKIEASAPFVSSITISGGEPLYQPAAVKWLARAARSQGLKVCLHTSGLLSWNLSQLLPELNYVVLDVKPGLLDPGMDSIMHLVRSNVSATIRVTTFPETDPVFVGVLESYYEDITSRVPIADRIKFEAISGRETPAKYQFNESGKPDQLVKYGGFSLGATGQPGRDYPSECTWGISVRGGR